MSEALYEIRFQDLMHAALQRGASDVHLVPGVRPFLRIHGRLEHVDGPVVAAEETALIVRRLMAEEAQERLRRTGDCTTTWSGLDDVLVRLHAFSAQGSTALALRILPQRIPTLESLRLPDAVLRFYQVERGLIIFAGPTGSGKSTSLAALISQINVQHARRIITIEDPIEYRHTSERSVIAQREVGRDAASFESALMGALRCDPDIIMVGEMRDAATMRAALKAAETGHLVLATLHTGGAIQTVDRIVDAFDGGEQSHVRGQLASVLAGVVCQRLLPRINGAGRCLAAEILIATEAVRATIREGRTHQLRNLMLTGRHVGMQTLEHHLSELLADGLIDDTVARAASQHHTEVRTMSAYA